MKRIAIVLAGGRGSRMNNDIPKQYIEVLGKPLLYYALNAFEKSPCVDGIVLVVPDEDREYCVTNILSRYNISKFMHFATAGVERYESVYNALSSLNSINKRDLVLIHDGARPCISLELIGKIIAKAEEKGNAVAAVPSKDTVKIVDDEGFCVNTPNRKYVWNTQTPQVFEYGLINTAYRIMMETDQAEDITDDAMVMEKFGKQRVYLCEADYFNIKVTTPEDIEVVERLLKKISK